MIPFGHKFDVEKLPDLPGCWIWLGTIESDGYGSVWWKNKKWRAHRAMYEIHKGPIGIYDVLHSCDIPSCVNPEHLFLGTDRDNQRDRRSKNKKEKQKVVEPKEFCKRGHRRTPENITLTGTNCIKCANLTRRIRRHDGKKN